MQASPTERFERLVRANKDAVYRQLVRVCGNYDDADDVLAESLAKAYRALGSLEDPDNFRAWLMQIGRRTCGRLRQKEAAAPFVAWVAGDDSAGIGPAQVTRLRERELKSCLLAALEALPATYRAVYELRDLDGLSAEEAAARLGITVPNLKSRLHRARRRVRESLDRALCTP